MKFKFLRLISIALVSLLVLTGCSAKDDEAGETVTRTLSAVKTRDDYIKSACGYYEYGNSYYKISNEYCEEKDKTDGTLLRDGTINDIETELLEDEKIKVTFIFYRDSYPRITLILCKNGDVFDENEHKMKRINKEDYDKIKAVTSSEYNLSDGNMSESDEENYVDETPWYVEEFKLNKVINDLGEIERLFATGKKTEAVKAFNNNVVGAIKSKIPELIKKREYWLAQNYLAMFQKKYPNTSECAYPFTNQYLKETYENKTTHDGIDTVVYPYYKEIASAAKSDTVEISAEKAVYKVNEVLINNNYPAVSRLRTTLDFVYLTDIVENYESVLFIIVNPYTQAVQQLDAEYFFTDGVYIPDS